ncbi:MAG: hypothetical protein CL567_03295 [Alphaproteobacteria bacterium]|nr:hypothetical protein [Alphaproteobacteria bacterium]
MIRIILFILLVGAIAALAVFLVDERGHVEIVWGDWLISTSPIALAAASLTIAFIFLVIWQISRWIFRGPRGIKRIRRIALQRKAYRHLTEGFLAAAIGDGGKAQKLARKAKTTINEPALALLLSAQAAQLEGQSEAAIEIFKDMMVRPETELLGIRGLLLNAKKSGNQLEVRELAERAYRIRPDIEWVLTTLLELRVRNRDYMGALKVLKESIRNNLISSDLAKIRRSALLVEASRKAKRNDNQRDAHKLAIRSVEIAPNFLPASIAAAEILIEMGRFNACARIIESFWKIAPHPTLGSKYRSIYEDRDIHTQIKRLERLTKISPDHTESQILMGSAALEAKLWGSARKHLLEVEKRSPSARVYRLLARLETDENQDTQESHLWLIKASEAPPEEVWRCGSCGAIHTTWHILCNSCASIDSIDWGVPFSSNKKLHEASILPNDKRIESN